jgi:hypothetical protein
VCNYQTAIVQKTIGIKSEIFFDLRPVVNFEKVAPECFVTSDSFPAK